MVNILTRFSLLLMLCIASMLALSGALVSEYVFGLKPCVLCLYQRIPYVVVIGLGVIGLVYKSKRQLLAMIACGVLLIGTGVAGYHVLVEKKIIIMETSCADTVIMPDSFEAMQAQLMATPNVPCDEPQFYFLGLTMAAWNLLFSTALVGYGWWRIRYGK